MRWTTPILLTLLVPAWPFAAPPRAPATAARARAPRAAAASSGRQAPRAAASAGPDRDRFAGRYALGKNMPLVRSKNGLTFARDGSEVRVLGGACSEALGGKNLHALLSDGCARSRGSRGCKKRRRPARARAFGL